MLSKIQNASEYIQNKLGERSPKIGVVLGSGLGHFAELCQDKLEISYSEIPHFHQTTVVGHIGKLVVGKINGTEVAIFQGRFHYYEGHPMEDVVLPVRVLANLGVQNLILTNASGGINPEYVPGDLVCLTDHINFFGNSPLIGPNEDTLGPRFPDMSETYNKELNSLLIQSAKELGANLKTGVYAGMHGPAYETPAEIRMLKVVGADLVGMSTVPEAIAANHAGLKVCAISCITNLAAGISKEKLSHDDVKVVANMAKEKFSDLLAKAIEKIGS